MKKFKPSAPLLASLALALLLPCLPSCATAPQTPAQKEAAADRRVKQATEHIRKAGRTRQRSSSH